MVGRYILAGLGSVLTALVAHSQALSLDLEAVLVPSVGATWVEVDLVNTYTSPIVVCTYVLPSFASNDATVRVQNAGATSFEVRVQQFETSDAVTSSDVHCLIADEGIHTLDDGKTIEARTVVSTGTSGRAVGWGSGTTENVTSLVTGGHSSLVVLGQVMSFNDSKASVFWTNNCSNRGTEPTPTAFCVGKHIGSITGTRANETLGFIVTSPGTGTVNDVDYAFAKGPDSVAGTGNSPPYQYTVSGNFETGVLTQAAEDGGDGGWAVLYGADPLPNNRINLAIEEEVVERDMSRTHTQEKVYYGVFRDNQTANLAASKTTDVYSGSSSAFAIPGSDMLYTLTVENSGTAPVDPDTVFLVDTLPAEVSFYNSDIDDGGPETGTIMFDPMSSGLTFTEGTDLRFSDAVAKPSSVADCNYTPSSGYDGDVLHVCFSPKGRLLGGAIQPDAEFSVTFRARID